MPGEGYCYIWVWFSSSLLWDRVYKSESWGLEQGIIFKETDQLVEDLSLDQGNRELPLKGIKNQIGFVLAGLCYKVT